MNLTNILRVGEELVIGDFAVSEEMNLAGNSSLDRPGSESGNFHTSVAAAQALGFPAPIVAGPHMTTIVGTQLLRRFELASLAGGRLQLTFRQPLFQGTTVTISASVTAVGHSVAHLNLVGVSDMGTHFRGTVEIALELPGELTA
jgi:acyl dehydratase